MRKEQAVRGHAKPQRHQMITIHQIPKAERIAPVAGCSWWTAYAGPAPSPDDFYAEVARRAAERINKAEKPSQYAHVMRPTPVEKAGPPISERRPCAVCGELFTLKPRGPHGVYCSHRCNQRAWKARRKSA